MNVFLQEKKVFTYRMERENLGFFHLEYRRTRAAWRELLEFPFNFFLKETTGLSKFTNKSNKNISVSH